MSCGVGHKRGLDPMLLWYRLAAASQIQPLAQELPYTSPAALKRKKPLKHTHTHKYTQMWNYPNTKSNLVVFKDSSSAEFLSWLSGKESD